MAVLGLPILGLALAAPTFAQSSGAVPPPPAPPSAPPPPTEHVLKGWRSDMTHGLPSKQGCFTSTYPSNQWQEVPCGTAPLIPYRPGHGVSPTVGNSSGDAMASVSGHISLSVGSFDSVTGVTSETGTNGANSFSLQLNSNTFTSPACAGGNALCKGWQQFVFSNTSPPLPQAFIQYWLIEYVNTCPAGWTANGVDCFQNSSAVFLPGQATISQLADMSMMGQAIDGGNDTLVFGVGTKLFAVQNTDTVLVLANGWTRSEFNVLGDGNGTAATFNSGSSIVVRVAVDSGTRSAPSCVSASTTAETNNLNFATAPTTQRGTMPAVIFTESTSGTTTPACNAATEVPSGELTDTHDFNGNTAGTSDILWRNSSSHDLAMWLMNNGTMSSGADLGVVSSVWSVAGTGDFNGDGNADILWLDTGGNVAVWLMDGTLTSGTIGFGNVGTQWSVAGTGDFNNDGVGDILWRNTSTGDVTIWMMGSNGQLSSSSDMGVVPTVWQVAGTGDFNGDGTYDILWRNTSTGDVAIWMMGNGQLSSSSDLGAVPMVWQVTGTGDLDGDGTSDIVWRDTSGNLAIWLISGGHLSSSSALGNVAPTWSIAETGDFNNDGKSDLLWIDTSGDLGIWFMNGLAVSSTVALGNIGATWQVQGSNSD